jgi:hypothetical protein
MEAFVMSQASFRPEIKGVLDSILLGMPNVLPGQMFGYPAYYVHKKLFACIYEDGVGIKLPVTWVSELVGKPGIIPFVPLGRRRMKEWVQINREQPADYLQDRAIFERSVDFVATPDQA